jgi:hypothetical protein
MLRDAIQKGNDGMQTGNFIISMPPHTMVLTKQISSEQKPVLQQERGKSNGRITYKENPAFALCKRQHGTGRRYLH